jgi:hypothetical protein
MAGWMRSPGAQVVANLNSFRAPVKPHGPYVILGRLSFVMVAQSAEPVLCSFPNTDALISALTAFIVKAQRGSIEKKGRFTIALSGGSLPSMLKGLIGNPDVKWDKWCVDYTGTS